MRLDEPAAGAATAILAHIFAVEPGTPEERTALYRRAATVALDVCRTGPWDELRDLALIARTDALGAATSHDLRRGALALLGTLEQPQAAHGLVAAVVARGSMTPAIEALLAAPGPVTIWAVAQRFAADPPSQAIEHLKDYVARLAAPTWRRAAEMVAAFPENDVLALLTLTAKLPRRLAREIVGRVAEHPDGKVRVLAQAFLTAMRSEPAPDSPEGA